jgi:hypothetical protein
MDWEQLFSASASGLKARLDEARASVAHNGLKGSLNERAFADWLRPYLPGALEVSAGEVIDSTGGRSRQVDVVVYDAMTTPRFLSRGGIDVLPVEPVFAVIEIKTFLNKEQIEKAFENMKAIKTLQKLAYHQQSMTTKSLYGVVNGRWPLQFFVFAYESDGLDSVLSHVVRLNSGQPLAQ